MGNAINAVGDQNPSASAAKLNGSRFARQSEPAKLNGSRFATFPSSWSGGNRTYAERAAQSQVRFQNLTV